MFSIETTIKDLKSREQLLFKVLFSMNIHQVANPEMSLEDARSYVFFFRDGGKFEVCIGLYFISSDRRMFYKHSSNPFPEEALADIEGEARNFAEDLGAMLDEIDFSRLSISEREHWIGEQEFLSGRKKQEETPVIEKEQKPAEDQQSPIPDQPVMPVAAPPVQPAGNVPPPATVAKAADLSGPVGSEGVHAVFEPVSQSAQKASVPPAVKLVGETQSSSVPEENAASAPPVRPQPKAQKKAAGRPAAQTERSEAPRAEEPVISKSGVDDVLDDAVRAGVVKAPKAQLKNEIRTASGGIGREKEALARLLASF